MIVHACKGDEFVETLHPCFEYVMQALTHEMLKT